MLRPIARARGAAVLVPLAAALVLSGCAGLGGNQGGDVAYVARDVESLYAEAKERLDRGDTKIAAALFDEVERQHPYSPWARRAQLMGAFANYVSRDYDKAIEGAQRFLSIHPGNKDAPYAYYLIALSYYEQISDVERDQRITRQALDALTEVQRRYPQTVYADDARLKIDLVNDHLAGKEMEIGRYYQRAGPSRIRFPSMADKAEVCGYGRPHACRNCLREDQPCAACAAATGRWVSRDRDAVRVRRCGRSADGARGRAG